MDLNRKDELAGQTPLFYAAKEGHVDMCKLLIESGAELTITDTSNETALYYAKKANKQECYEYLTAYFQTLKDEKKLLNDNGESLSKADERPKKKRKDHQSNTKNQNGGFVLVRSDKFGNHNELVQE